MEQMNMDFPDGWCAEPKIFEQDYEPDFVWYDIDGTPHHKPKIPIGFDLSVNE